MPLIELSAVTKTYNLGDTSILALKEINLLIEKGEFVAVWGPSGSGKSTLCNLIGLLDTPSSGDIILDNKIIKNLSDDKRSELRSEYLGFVFQDFNLFPVLDAVENVMLPLQIVGRKNKMAKEKAIDLLTELGLGKHLDHRPTKLSGGQQQRVAIARALITDPAIIIADEPTANLDSVTAKKIIDRMHKLNKSRNTTFIFSTHDQRLLDKVERKILLEDGVVVEGV